MTHFLTRCTTDKLCRHLDLAAEQSAPVVVCEFLGGRDWLIVTAGQPILGPASSRVITIAEGETHGEPRRRQEEGGP